MFRVTERKVDSLIPLEFLKQKIINVDWSEDDDKISNYEKSAINRTEQYLGYPITKSTAVKIVRASKIDHLGFKDDPDKLISNNNSFRFQRIPIESVTGVNQVSDTLVKTPLSEGTDYVFDSISNRILFLNNTSLFSNSVNYLEVVVEMGWSPGNCPSAVLTAIENGVTHMYDEQGTEIPFEKLVDASKYKFYRH